MPDEPFPELPDAAGIGVGILARAEALAACSEPGAGVTRRFATPEHRAANALILDWMREAGMTAEVDAIGNIVGRYEGVRPGLPALFTGSHQDTVREGGRYDGMLGFLAPIACVAALNARGERLPFAVEVIVFSDEEGLRFGTSMFGSTAIAGSFDAAVFELRDEEGVTVAEAMRGFGLDPGAVSAIARPREAALGFVEVHIEQGPVLEAEGLPVGVVTAITGSTRLQVTLGGKAGHAGTTPMGSRRDALAASAEAILAVEAHCTKAGSMVGTVGTIDVAPGAINVIPASTRFSIDLRAPEDDRRRTGTTDVRDKVRAICVRRGVSCLIETIDDADATACAPWIMDQLDDAVREEGHAPRRLFSGAGHDAATMAGLTDVGMLFVRCKDGLSHHPDESITAGDAGTAARTLLRFMRNFRRP